MPNPKASLAGLFMLSPFFRSKSNHNGIGLGLSIAKRAIEVNGGSIHAENIIKQGIVSGFYVLITLPTKRSERNKHLYPFKYGLHFSKLIVFAKEML
ncbi:MAG TPA: hypothetical protein VLA40_09375 [Rheinheimera sp.]|nr:hypothetical protein [Rheinheimera sp.]